MDYNAPPGAASADAPYVNGIPGVQKGSPVPAEAVEYPQREIVNVIKAAGIAPDNAQLDQLLRAILSLSPDWAICKLVLPFISSVAPAGWVPMYGTVLQDAPTVYPKAWAYLLSAEGQQMCTTEALWQQASTAVYYTDAAGNQYGWEGIGGVCKYVVDVDNGTIRVPDVRGLHQEGAGYNSLAVGGTVFAGLPNIEGMIHSLMIADQAAEYGAISYKLLGNIRPSNGTHTGSFNVYFNASRSNPHYGGSPTVQPRSYGVLPCVYLGS